MIGNYLSINLSLEERKNILNRALRVTPFYNFMPFEIVTGADTRTPVYQAKSIINKDFYITELLSNFGEAFLNTNSHYLLSVYSSFTGKSLYGYNRGELLPAGMLCQEMRYQAIINTQLFDDKQREWFPYKVSRGDLLIGEIQNLSVKAASFEGELVTKGYTLNANPYLPNMERINRSLDLPINFEYFKIPVDYDDTKTPQLQNDIKPRLVLGFGIVNRNATKTDISNATVLVTDETNGYRWQNSAFPIEYLAPRLTCLRDTHIYYLPVEYYFQPYGVLSFKIFNDLITEFSRGFDLYILTRTV